MFQWKKDSECTRGLSTWTDADRTSVSEELSDVLLYLVQLADACGIDLPTAVARKMKLNALKYPPSSATKTTATKEDDKRAREELAEMERSPLE